MSQGLTNAGQAQLARFDDKFDRIVKAYRSENGLDGLPALLREQLRRWETIYALMQTGKYPKDSQVINLILQKYPDISTATARTLLSDTRRFFGVVSDINPAFERVMQINDLKGDIRAARRKGDFRSVTGLMKLLSELTGTDKPDERIENKTVINVLNYNPAQLGGQAISEEQLQGLVAKMLADDEKKKRDLFDDFEDVTTNQP